MNQILLPLFALSLHFPTHHIGVSGLVLSPGDSKQIDISEDTQVGTTWDFHVAGNSAENSVVKYDLICGDCDKDSKGTFELRLQTASDGSMLPKLKLVKHLDYEKKKAFKLRGTAEYKDGNSDPYFVTINVMDINEAPVFPKPIQGKKCSRQALVNRVHDNQAVGSVIDIAKASDEDSGINGQVEYGFSSDKNQSKIVRYFSINKVTGEITLIKPLLKQGDDTKMQQIKIYAKDKAASPLKDEMVWKFFILKTQKPQIKFISTNERGDCEIPENGDKKGEIGYFEITDEAGKAFPSIAFNMVNGTHLFELKAENGRYALYPLIRFDRQLQERYVITFKAEEFLPFRSPKAESTKSVVFRVCAENDKIPAKDIKEKLVDEL